ncbi:60s Acidic ribosomal family protein [Acanthocheilonema viteae]|uniref:Large ribosomal subunit protein P2 n=1 Tax=Acanthocheilonema viteae TaxID=6277 RepID=A0A498SQ16_ACAVI|nr:unnamed protein product [Acanthocheilonema viteae]
MRYVSAYMLAMMGSKHHVTANDIENILGSVGVDCERVKAEEVVKKMQGKTLDELITEGSNYFASVSTSPSIGVTPVATVAASSTDTKDAVTALPVEKQGRKEKEEESDEDLGFGLFD